MPLIYITDDEPNIRKLLTFGLKDNGFESQEFSNGAELLDAVKRRMPDAILLDWMMPPPDGLAVCRTLRGDAATRNVPILMLTARGEEIDKVLGLELGADDYITKPFGMQELCARLRAVLRRSQGGTPAQDEVLRQGELTLDVGQHIVSKGGQTVELTAKEFDLLAALMRSKGRVLTRDALLDKVWGVEYYGDTRTVDVHVRYLRQKIEDDPENPTYVQTVRGVGYRFRPSGQE